MASHHDRYLMRMRICPEGVIHLGDVDDDSVVHEPDEPPPLTPPEQPPSPTPPKGF